MGNKIITEKDFFQCSGGMMPSPFQSTQLIVKKKTGDKYITLNDTSTVSWVDFGCKKLMLLYAVIAAIAVIAVALIVGTGGLALVAVGAAAGALGAVMGAIDGSSICGQKVSPVRKWLGSNANFQILGINTITGDHKMQCNAFNMLGMSPEYITFKPEIKNWSQAIAMGSASFAANVLQGAMTGMMIGGAAVAIPALATGGMAAVTEGGGMGLARYLGGNVAKNYLASWFTAEGLGLRGVMGVQSGLDSYGQTGSVSGSDVGHGIVGMESGTAESAKNISTGNGNMLDVLGLALWLTPAGELIKGKEAKTESKAPNENGGKSEEGNGNKGEEENAKPTSQAEVKPEEVKAGEEEAYQADGTKKAEFETVEINGKKVKRLKPNQEYEANGYNYKTDGEGRIEEVNGDLSKDQKGGRNPYAQRTVGKNDGRLTNDHGGHLIGDQFGGAGGKENMVPMDADVNNYHKGKWGQMEKKWSNAIDDGKTVNVKIKPQYTDMTSRPSSFEIEETIDGDVKNYEIINK